MTLANEPSSTLASDGPQRKLLDQAVRGCEKTYWIRTVAVVAHLNEKCFVVMQINARNIGALEVVHP